MLFYFLSFFLTFLYSLKRKSILTILSLIMLLSVGGTLFLGRELRIDYITDILFLLLILFLFLAVILPWNNFQQINLIKTVDKKKLKLITTLLIFINSYVFIILLLTTFIVVTTIKDVNEFKYAEGVSQDFYTRFLPFNVSYFNLAIISYYFAYLILPLHFYYLHKNKLFLSFICFLLSLNIVLYGLTFFSRAVIIQYFFLYITMFWFFKRTIKPKTLRTIKTLFSVLLGISLLYFINISVKRFKEDKDALSDYSRLIPQSAIIKDPMLYSYADYSSQAFYNGFEIIQKYDNKTFNGQLSLQSLNSLLGSFNIIEYDSRKYLNYRSKLWPSKYSYSFNGYPAYLIYDFGILGAIIFSMLYYYIVYRLRPLNRSISLRNTFLLVLLIQIPLMSIFYNQLGGILIAFIILIPFYIYLKKQ